MNNRTLVRIASLRSTAEFRAHCSALGLSIPCDAELQGGPDSPLAQQFGEAQINEKRIGNRIAIQPMEGWDGTGDGRPTEDTVRRWQRFGESGAKLIYGGEAMAVCPEGRANPNQLIIDSDRRSELAKLREVLVATHKARYGTSEDLIIGFQLTHSGRFCRPTDKKRLEPRIAYRHPILDRRFGIVDDGAVLSDAAVEKLVADYANAARVAAEAGADFVDIKHCHGYLLHEFLGAHTRSGKYGGSFENRTRVLREIVAAVRSIAPHLDIGVRLSAFDFIPYRPDPALSEPGKPGPGIPEDFSHCLPYRFGFGVNGADPTEYDLEEPFRFVHLCAELGVKLLNLTAGSPYYNPHIQRPAAYPPSDGYQPAYDPLVDVARQIDVVRQVKSRAPATIGIIGSAYSYLQEFLPNVAQAVVREKWTDFVGVGRATLSYPSMLSDVLSSRPLEKRLICRTFSDCTTAPRNGLVSGCYPLDKYYSAKPEAEQLKQLKRQN